MRITQKQREEQLSLWQEELTRLEQLDGADLTRTGKSMLAHQILTARQNIEYLETGTVDGETWEAPTPQKQPAPSVEEKRRKANWKLQNARQRGRRHAALAENSKPPETRLDPGELSIPGRAGKSLNRDLDQLKKYRYHLDRVHHYRRQEQKALEALEKLK